MFIKISSEVNIVFKFTFEVCSNPSTQFIVMSSTFLKILTRPATPLSLFSYEKSVKACSKNTLVSVTFLPH